MSPELLDGAATPLLQGAMIVVSDTSPLTNLAAIEQFDLLRHLYGELHIADGVWDELNAGGRRWPGHGNVEAADWIRLHAGIHGLRAGRSWETD